MGPATSALGALGDPRAIPALHKLKSDPSVDVKATANEAILTTNSAAVGGR